MRRIPLLLAVAALAMATAGCFDEILPQPPVSTLAFACAAIDPTDPAHVRIVTYAPPDVDVSGPSQVLAEQLHLVSGRAAADIVSQSRAPPKEPAAGWTESRLSAWARDEPFVGRDQVLLRVLWLDAVPGNLSGLVPAPGAVVVSLDAVTVGAARLGKSPDQVATAVLLHFVGHALGATNRGIPVQDPLIQEREDPAGHDADAASVLAVGWESAATMAWAANATYDHWPAAALADWSAAREAHGTCGVRR